MFSLDTQGLIRPLSAQALLSGLVCLVWAFVDPAVAASIVFGVFVSGLNTAVLAICVTRSSVAAVGHRCAGQKSALAWLLFGGMLRLTTVLVGLLVVHLGLALPVVPFLLSLAGNSVLAVVFRPKRLRDIA